MPKNTDVTALEAYNTCMEMELDKRNKYRDDSEVAVDQAVGLLIDILSSWENAPVFFSLMQPKSPHLLYSMGNENS